MAQTVDESGCLLAECQLVDSRQHDGDRKVSRFGVSILLLHLPVFVLFSSATNPALAFRGMRG